MDWKQKRQERDNEQTLLLFERLILSLESELQTARLSRRQYNKLTMRQKIWEHIYYSQDFDLMNIILDKFEVLKPLKAKKIWKVELSRSKWKPISYEGWWVLVDWWSCTNWHWSFSYAERCWPSKIADLFRKGLLDWDEACQAMELLECDWKVVKI
jgi:hypothetical protein